MVISHNLADVFAVADRIVVLRLGAAGRVVGRRRQTQLGRRSSRAITGAIDGDEQHSGGAGVMTRTRARAAPDRRAQRGLPAPRRDFRRRLVQGTWARCACSSACGHLDDLPVANDRLPHAQATSPTSCCRSPPRGTISVGVVLVLLLGEIDLSVGAVSGVPRRDRRCSTSSTAWPRWLAIAVAVAAGAGHRRAPGVLRDPRSGIPAFVVTLAGLLAWQGACCCVLG